MFACQGSSNESGDDSSADVGNENGILRLVCTGVERALVFGVVF